MLALIMAILSFISYLETAGYEYTLIYFILHYVIQYQAKTIVVRLGQYLVHEQNLGGCILIQGNHHIGRIAGIYRQGIDQLMQLIQLNCYFHLTCFFVNHDVLGAQLSQRKLLLMQALDYVYQSSYYIFGLLLTQDMLHQNLFQSEALDVLIHQVKRGIVLECEERLNHKYISILFCQNFKFVFYRVHSSMPQRSMLIVRYKYLFVFLMKNRQAESYQFSASHVTDYYLHPVEDILDVNLKLRLLTSK